MNETVVESSAKAVVELNEKIRVLHVDDDSGVLRITKQCLEMEAAIQVDTALSVEEALAKLEREKFDIVVSDYQMPGKDGLDLLKKLRSNENAIPFIMFTGKGREEVAIKALNLGANQYLNKVGETETVYTELAHSITELAKTRKAEEKQCESEEKFRSLFEKANDGLVFVDVSGRIIDINQKAAELAKKRKEDLVGKSFLDLGIVSARNLPALAKNLSQQAIGKPTEILEVEIERENGEKRLIEISSTFIQRSNIATGSLAIVRDITERKKAEEELKESEERYSRLSAAAFEGIGISEQGKIVDANDQLEKMLGYEPREMIGKAVLDIVAPESRKLVMENMQKGCEGPYEHLAIRKDSSVLPVEIRARSIPYKGHTARVSAIRDLSEGKKTEETLKGAHEKLQLFLTAARASIDGFVHLDLEGRILELNDAALKMCGANAGSDMIGENSLDMVIPEEREKIAGNMREAMAKGKSSCKGIGVITRKGARIIVDYSITLVRDAEGRPVGFLGILRDMTESKQMEKKMMEVYGWTVPGNRHAGKRSMQEPHTK